MSYQIQLRRDSAANWSTTNPILAQGEIGLDTTNNKIKIGDGSSTWNSLSYGPSGFVTNVMTTTGDIIYSSPGSTPVRLPIGTANQVLTVIGGVPSWQPSAASVNSQFFGSGSDGNVTISAGTTTLSRDMFYDNLTINGTGQIEVNGFKIFVKGTLDITAAPNKAIYSNAVVGANGSAAGAGAGFGTNRTTGSLENNDGGGAGGSGTTGAGQVSPAVGTPPAGNGGNSGASGAGGAGVNAGGALRAGVSVPTGLLMNRQTFELIKGATLLNGGAPGPGGGGGGGNGTESGGGGGAGGCSGGVIYIAANTINRSGSTASGAIWANGANGGNGATNNAVTLSAGGGGGGGGAGGGWVYISYSSLTGSTATNAIDTSGGAGGNGGAGKFAAGYGGNGGNGGNGGSVTLYNTTSITCTHTIGASGSAGTAGTINAGGTGGAGGSGLVSL